MIKKDKLLHTHHNHIEGFFDEQGVLNGHGVRIKYRNGRLIKATVVKGVMHGLVLEHDVKIDPETNRPSEDSPVLSKISLYNITPKKKYP